MAKEVGAFSLIIFLFVILAAWWAVTSFQPPHHFVLSTQASPAVDSAFVYKNQIAIYHSKLNGSEVYSGSVTIPNCDEFLTGISAIGRSPAHLRLSFTVSKATQACSSQGVSSVPFTVSFSSSKAGTPILDGVTINDAAAAFSVVDVK